MRFIYFMICYLLINTFQTISITPKNPLEKPLVVVSCMYNNAAWATKNLDSVFHQKYDNFRIIIVDDGSDDGTAEIIENYIQTHHLQNKITFIKNKQRKRKLANLYQVMYLIDDLEIAVMLDGDDWLAHDNVFNMINAWYQNILDNENSKLDVWFTFGQYYNVPESEARHWGWNPRGYANKIPKHVLESGNVRQDMFRYMHLRTFYGWLFKQIALKDLICLNVEGYQGDFYPAANDLAIYYPIVEMALRHIKFNSEIIYIRNLYSDIVGFKIDHTIQKKSASEIRKKEPYPTLTSPIFRNLDQYKNAACSIYVLCNNQDDKAIDAYIAKLYEIVRDEDTIYVVYKQGTQTKHLKYLLKKRSIKYKALEYRNHHDLLNHLYDELEVDPHAHCIFVNPDTDLHNIDLSEMIYWLERTFASSFLIGCLSEKPFVRLTENIAARSCYFLPLNSDLNRQHAPLMRKKDAQLFIQKGILPCDNFGNKHDVYLFYWQ